ncbi:MAG TPA: ABC transporter permease [Candidatus Sulfotelmatobacter sp.]|nr:ABC transporter permease [Candidatus Sulfotelmatobacter sp.]
MKWWQLKKRDADLERELRSDLELEEEEQREEGLPPEEARYAARRALGNTTVIKEQTHEAWGWAQFERMGQDIRYATRQLGKSPGFSIVTVLTLALGIGATTAIFTLVYDVMLRPLPFAKADRLVTMEEVAAEWSNIYPTLPVSANHFTFWQRNSRSFDSMTVMQQGSAPLGADGRPSQVGVLSATPSIFSVLKVQPQFGRAFTDDEARPGNERVAVLMYDLWREQFGRDPGIVGKTIQLNGFPYTVIGVMPQSFHMPPVLATLGNTSRQLPIGVLEPLAFSKERLAEQMGDLNYFGLARLKPGVSPAAATADLNALQHTISMNLPADEKATLSAVLTPFQKQLVGNNRKPLIILLAGVAGLLLVGCVNVTNLLLARAVGQKQQMAVASALGARRAELVRMALREIAVLAAVGGGLGILLASGIVPAMQRYLPPALDFRGPLHLDWAGAGCALLLAVLASLLAGAAPAFMVSHTAPNEVLHTESRLASESRTSRRARRVLVGFEVSVSVALVLMTGLLTTSLVKLMQVDRGFTTERTVTAMIDLPTMSYRDDQHRAAFYREVLEGLDRLPGMEHAAITSVLPLTGDSWGDMARVAGDRRPVTQLPLESFRWISPDYFSTIHLQLTAGRLFAQNDWGKDVAVISEKTAKMLWPGKNPVGLQFRRGDRTKEQPFTVIGVVANARTISLAKPDPMLIYVPYWYRCEQTAGLVVRTHQDPSDMADTIRRTVWSVDPNVPVPTVRALGGVVADSVANQRFEMDLLLLFAASAVFLAGLGVYGVVTYSVVQRSREIGLRIALGAQRTSVYRLVLRDGLFPVVVGAIVGVALAFGSARAVSSLLFQVSPYDPVLAVGAVSALLAVGTIACLLPARSAASVQPMQALRMK